MTRRKMPIIELSPEAIALLTKAESQRRPMPTVDSPLTARRIGYGEVVTALARPPKTARYWIDTIGLIPPESEGGWHSYSVIDVATLAIAARLIDHGMSVREAGDHARALVLERTRLLASYRNTPADMIVQAFAGCLVVAWRDGEGWTVAPNWTEDMGMPSGAVVLLLPEVIIREALDRLEGGDHG